MEVADEAKDSQNCLTLLDVSEEYLQTYYKGRLSISRLVFVAKLHTENEKAHEDVVHYFKSSFHTRNMDIEPKGLKKYSGIIITHNNSLIAYLEIISSQECVDFVKNVLNGSSLLHGIRILASYEDLPDRLIPCVHFAKSSFSRSSKLEINPENLTQVVHEIHSNIMALVQKISQCTTDSDASLTLSDICQTDTLQQIPSNDDTLILSECEDIMDINDFVEVFASPLLIEFESEAVWPIHPIIQY